MSHHKNGGGIGQQRIHGIGHDAALDLCALFCLSRTAAVKFKGILIADDRLVSSAGERHFNRQIGKFQKLLKALSILADTDGNGCTHPGWILYFMYGIQNIKFFLNKFLKIALLKHHDIAFSLITAQNRTGSGHPVIQTGINFSQKSRTLIVRKIFVQVIVVIDQQYRCNRTGVPILIPHLSKLSNLHPIGSSQKAASPPTGTHQIAEHHKFSRSNDYLMRTLIFSLHKPLGIKIRNNSGQLGIKYMLPLPSQPQKPVVAPDNIAAFRTENYHRQRCIHHGVLGCHIHISGNTFNIFCNFTLPVSEIDPIIKQQQDHTTAFRSCHRQTEKSRYNSK